MEYRTCMMLGSAEIEDRRLISREIIKSVPTYVITCTIPQRHRRTDRRKSDKRLAVAVPRSAYHKAVKMRVCFHFKIL